MRRRAAHEARSGGTSARLGCLLVLLISLPAIMQSQQMFVRVCPSDRTRFEADGRPFYFAGANCYYLLASAAT